MGGYPFRFPRSSRGMLNCRAWRDGSQHTPSVIPDAPTGAGPEFIGPQSWLRDGFRARDFVAPRNDTGKSGETRT